MIFTVTWKTLLGFPQLPPARRLLNNGTEKLTDDHLHKLLDAAVLGEMQSALAGRFDSFGLWAAHPVHGDTTAFMYVPSVGYFVPYWHP
jgi:hypothetical protein